MAQPGRIIGRWWATWCAIVRRDAPEADEAGGDAGAGEAGAPFDRERWERVYSEQALELARLRELNRLLDRVTDERRRVRHHRPRRRTAASQVRHA
jgi:hypothetical protein